MSPGLPSLLLQLGRFLLDALWHYMLLVFFLVCLVIAMEAALIASKPFRPRTKPIPRDCKYFPPSSRTPVRPDSRGTT